MKIAFLFPGQGSQTLGMGKDLYEKYEDAKKIYDMAKNITNIDIAKLSFEGPEEKLNQTQYTQVAILTNSLSILEILKKYNINAEVSAGLSLGEYSALIYSNALDIESGIKLVQKRGEYMQNLCPKGDWQMAALLGVEEKTAEEICKKISKGFAVVANYNCKGQIVISGDKEGIAEVENLARNEFGIKKLRILKTSGPFHTIKLEESSKKLYEELEKITFNKFDSKVIKNLDGTAYSETDNIKQILSKHIISPVRFSASIENMINMGIDTFIEIGPGKTLTGFVKRTRADKKINLLNINNVSSLEESIKFFKEAKNYE